MKEKTKIKNKNIYINFSMRVWFSLWQVESIYIQKPLLKKETDKTRIILELESLFQIKGSSSTSNCILIVNLYRKIILAQTFINNHCGAVEKFIGIKKSHDIFWNYIHSRYWIISQIGMKWESLNGIKYPPNL